MDYLLAARIAGVGMAMVFMVLIAIGVVVRLTSVVIDKVEDKDA